MRGLNFVWTLKDIFKIWLHIVLKVISERGRTLFFIHLTAELAYQQNIGNFFRQFFMSDKLLGWLTCTPDLIYLYKKKHKIMNQENRLDIPYHPFLKSGSCFLKSRPFRCEPLLYFIETKPPVNFNYSICDKKIESTFPRSELCCLLPLSHFLQKKHGSTIHADEIAQHDVSCDRMGARL